MVLIVTVDKVVVSPQRSARRRPVERLSSAKKKGIQVGRCVLREHRPFHHSMNSNRIEKIAVAVFTQMEKLTLHCGGAAARRWRALSQEKRSATFFVFEQGCR